jgi:phage terminase large subunit-like protein
MAPRKVKGWPPAILTPVPLADRRRGDGASVVEFIEALCPQVKDSIGGNAGEPLVLRPWQRNFMAYLFARRPDGRYRHRIALGGLARKNGKSALGSGIALYGLLTGPRGGEVYSCAADRDQARIVFGSAKAMVEQSPELSEQTKLYRDAIEVPSTGSVYRVLSAEAFTKEGLSPTLVIYDELHAAPTPELWSVMTLAQAARRDAMTIGLTTAGVKTDSTGQDSTCFRLYQYGQRVASGEIDDPSFFMAWWKSRDDADHRLRASWLPGNPGFGDLQDPEDFDSAVKRTPENEFRTKRMNLWVNTTTAWLPSGMWAALPKAGEIDRDVPVVVGFDGSFSNDSTCLVGCTVEPRPRIFLIAAWEKQPDDDDTWRVSSAEVDAAVMSLPGRYNLVELACDPYRWSREMETWADAGLPVVEYNSASPARMVPATAKFYDAVTSDGIAHDHDPTLARHIDNCAVKTDRLGPRIVKEHRGSPRKIDAAVCAVLAFDRATAYREEPAAPMPFFL